MIINHYIIEAQLCEVDFDKYITFIGEILKQNDW